ncbi:hypothetical protein [Microbacterium sp. 77mftsu3.1]|uniref:hypothetical protein n=1 Tax=Microbacterium sp. 77mftsu3.1 TaxID=1761802 RepID=UPI0003742D06|nr:hypothetical protein [Microbacterium sp. 77mftsu3.1]SDH34853.1 hypothetical protein SAMN04488590_3096 [Microbacterium sp. 77mftsu3.1]
MADINALDEQNREAARRRNGQFGNQAHSAPDSGLLDLAAAEAERADAQNGIFLHFSKPLAELTPQEVEDGAPYLYDEDLDECIDEARSQWNVESDRRRAAEKRSHRYGPEYAQNVAEMEDADALAKTIAGNLAPLEAERTRRRRVQNGGTSEHAAALDAHKDFRDHHGTQADAAFAEKLLAYQPKPGEARWRSIATAEFGRTDSADADELESYIESRVRSATTNVGAVRGPLRAVLPVRLRGELEEMVVRKHFGSFSGMQEAIAEYSTSTAERLVAMLEDADNVATEARRRAA